MVRGTSIAISGISRLRWFSFPLQRCANQRKRTAPIRMFSVDFRLAFKYCIYDAVNIKIYFRKQTIICWQNEGKFTQTKDKILATPSSFLLFIFMHPDQIRWQMSQRSDYSKWIPDMTRSRAYVWLEVGSKCGMWLRRPTTVVRCSLESFTEF